MLIAFTYFVFILRLIAVMERKTITLLKDLTIFCQLSPTNGRDIRVSFNVRGTPSFGNWSNNLVITLVIFWHSNQQNKDTG